MAKLIEYDVTGVEESSGGTGVVAKPGLYVAKIMLCEYRDTKNDGTPANDIRLGLSVGEEYDWVFTYIGLSEAADWKLAEFVRALGLKDKGKINPDKVKGQLIRVKLNPGSYNGEYRPEAGRLMKVQPGDSYGSTASEISQSQNGSEPEAAVEDEQPTNYTDGFEPSREDDPEVGSYDDWADADLLAEVEDRGLTLPGGRGAKRDKAISALRAEDESVTAVVEGEDDAEAAPEAADDYDSWELEQLTTEWEERSLGDLPSFRGRNAEERLKSTIVEALREDDAANPFAP